MTVEYALAGGVATVTLNRPEVRNAVNLHCLTEPRCAVARVAPPEAP